MTLAFAATPEALTMPYPKKFRHLIDLDTSAFELPTRAWIEYCVCATETDSCGWQGWTLSWAEGVAGRGHRLPADDRQRCPRCHRGLYGVGSELAFALVAKRPEPLDVEVVGEPAFVDDPDAALADEYAGVEFHPTSWSDDSDHAHCEVCSDRISSDPYENREAYTYKDGCWLCGHCYDRIQKGLARLD
jgi:hypothetical protein